MTTAHHPPSPPLELSAGAQLNPVAEVGAPRTRWQAIWKARWIVLLTAIVAAGLALAISQIIPKRFSSSATVRVTLPESAGISEQSVQAANDLASQYAQVATAGPIVAGAADKLGPAGRGLTGAISASTVASENLVQITASASSPTVAQERANATAIAFTDYLNKENAKTVSSSASESTQRLSQIQTRLQAAELKIDTDLATREGGTALSAKARAGLTALQNEVASLQGLQQSLLTAQVGGGTPTLRVFSPAGSASQTQPRPALYATVAFLVALLIAAQIAALVGTQRRVVS